MLRGGAVDFGGAENLEALTKNLQHLPPEGNVLLDVLPPLVLSVPLELSCSSTTSTLRPGHRRRRSGH